MSEEYIGRADASDSWRRDRPVSVASTPRAGGLQIRAGGLQGHPVQPSSGSAWQTPATPLNNNPLSPPPHAPQQINNSILSAGDAPLPP